MNSILTDKELQKILHETPLVKLLTIVKERSDLLYLDYITSNEIQSMKENIMPKREVSNAG